MKKLFNYMTGFHNIPVIADLSTPVKINTVNACFLDIPKDGKFVEEISRQRKAVDGVLSPADIIRDTFRK